MKSTVGLTLVLCVLITACGKTGAPSGSGSPPRQTSRFVALGDQIQDPTTGLTWQRCSVGQTWTADKACVGEISLFSYAAAQQLGSETWRLPTRDELLALVDDQHVASLVERQRRAYDSHEGALSDATLGAEGLLPLIDAEAFPGMGTGLAYWTSTPLETDPQLRNAWVVNFGQGSHDLSDRQELHAARLVRRRKLETGSAPSSFRQFAITQYAVANDQVYDEGTGLIWQRCSVGQKWDGDKHCIGEPAQFTFAETQHLGQDEWRVPTGSELSTLITDGPPHRQVPAIDATAFPDQSVNPDLLWYWSSTGSPGSPRQARAVNFAAGLVSENAYIDTPHSVRLVRTRTLADGSTTARPASQGSNRKADAKHLSIRGDQVYDPSTDLTWQRCSVGQRWESRSGCIGNILTFSYDDAQRLARAPWRVPTKDEMATLLEETPSGKGPSLDTEAFPSGASYPFSYWTATPDDIWSAWGLFFQAGLAAGGNDRRSAFAVRLVRSGSGAAPAPFSEGPSVNERFQIHGAEVFDRETRLTWRRCTAGHYWVGKLGCVGIRRAFSFQGAHQLSNGVWRMPTRDELSSLVDPERLYAGLSPTIDPAAFPDVSPDDTTYWSGTTNGGAVSWGVNFKPGQLPPFDGYRDDSRFPVLLVRDNQ